MRSEKPTVFSRVPQRGEEKGRKKEIGRHMSREFLREPRYALENSAEMDVSMVPGLPPRRAGRDVDDRSRRMRARARARFSRIFDACGMHRRRNIIYILCERWQPRGLEPLDALWRCNASRETLLPPRKRGLHDARLPNVENVRCTRCLSLSS